MEKEKRYRIKEIFYSIQGEGYHSGKPAVFIRFSKCNLWSGKEKEREVSICKFCDTDFVGTDGNNGGEYSSIQLISKINEITKISKCKFVVLTGGEPLLQLDKLLINDFHSEGYFLALETNGTINAPENIDWITVSPKFGVKFNQNHGDEIKIVFPQKGIEPKDYLKLNFKHYYLQPKDENKTNNNTNLTLDYCLKHPEWKISIQLHKILNIE